MKNNRKVRVGIFCMDLKVRNRDYSCYNPNFEILNLNL